jgi:type IV secretion system protein VirB11
VSETGIYLDSLLAPLTPWLERPDVTDVYINRPQELWIEALGGETERHACTALTEPVLMRLARQIAARSAQGISRAHPLLGATLPDGSRVQIVMPPAARETIVLAIRKHVAANRTLADYADDGSFDGLRTGEVMFTSEVPLRSIDPANAVAFLADAVRERRNILIAGGTSTGKTTFLNALLKEIPSEERLILIEDTPELELTHKNSVGLLAARSELSEADLSAEDLLIAALRMRPDRIILGELRGREAFTFLRAVNTGHPGSMTTIHADSPRRAVEQLALLVLQSGAQLRWEDVLQYVRASIDVYVQLERERGRRRVSALMVRGG